MAAESSTSYHQSATNLVQDMDDEAAQRLQETELEDEAKSEIKLNFMDGWKKYNKLMMLMQSRLGPHYLHVLQLKLDMARIASGKSMPLSAQNLYFEVMNSTCHALIQNERGPNREHYSKWFKTSVEWISNRGNELSVDGHHDKANFLLRQCYERAQTVFGDSELSQEIKNRVDITARRSKSSRDRPMRVKMQEDKSPDIPKRNDGDWAFHDNILLTFQGTAEGQSEDWFKLLQDHTQTLLDPYRPYKAHEKKTYDRVRIAILDTGIDGTNTEVQQKMDRLIDYKSWIPSDGVHNDGADHGTPMAKKDWYDDSGHGTHVAMTLLRVAPEADLYIARVFSKYHTKLTEPVVSAMKWAVEECKAEIMVMTFGGPRIDMRLFEAIRYAAFRNVLMFAAATNNGKNERTPRTYPGRDYRVFAIHSTDGLGVPSRFNASAQDGDPNFAILGECIYGPDLQNRTICRTGTSIAASIAAGVAALILEFAAQERVDNGEVVENAEILKTHQGMRHVFKATSVQGAGYRYLLPWKILTTTILYPEKDKRKIRNEVARQLSQILRDW